MSVRDWSSDVCSSDLIATIHSFKGDMELQSRLVEMGILPGISIRRIKTAPMNGPIELKVRDYHVSLRQNDARNILIK
jgi:Fe2+ transport system protein FeoA